MAAIVNEALELLVLELAGTRYGLPLRTVREVARAVLIEPLSDAPPVIEGLICVRGVVVPVYDLRLRFGLPPRRLSPADRLVIAWTGERLVAIRCEGADRIVAVAPERVESGAAVLRYSSRLAGVAQLEDGLILIQDLAAFLDEAEYAALETALERSAASAGQDAVP